MIERGIDRAIDAAAGDMMAREPGRALSASVMVRIREDAVPARRWMVAAAATASFALCAVIATVWMIRVPAPVASLPPALQLPVARAATIPVAPGNLSRDPRRAAFVASPAARRGQARPPLPPTDVSAIAAIEVTSLAVPEIDVPDLDREAVAIEVIDIQPLTIEPLAASND